MTTWRFPPLSHPSVFIAAPGDLEYLREAAILELDALRRQVGHEDGLQVYDWQLDKADDGFKDWIPAQGQIPLPSDPKCRAVVCMLGERIGTPLTCDFDTASLGPLKDIHGGGARLVHPWIDGSEAKGGFALTGTVFEYLAALRSNTVKGRPPVKLLIVGDDTIRDQPNPLHANWGGGRLRNKGKARCLEENPIGLKWEDEFDDWKARYYKPQIRQLGNFVRYLNDRHNTFPLIVENEEEAREHIRRFLGDALGFNGGGASTRDPFKGLEAYAEADADVFFGREDDRRKAVHALTALWDDISKPTFYGVIGGSGVGKSSMIRAALVGHLNDTTSYGRYVGCVVRPADLLVAAGPETTARPLLALYRLALEKIHAKSKAKEKRSDLLPLDDGNASAVPDLSEVEDLQPAFVLEQLNLALQSLGQGWRLLIGFDQFEELLDQRSSEEGRYWQPVVEFILLAVNHPAMGVVYTLQANRQDLIAHDRKLGPLCEHGDQMSLRFPFGGMEAIIRKPFEARGILLEARLVRELNKQIMEFAGGPSADSQESLLPLVSLTLRRIFNARGEEIVARSIATEKPVDSLNPAEGGVDGGSASAVAADRSPPMLRLSDCAGLMDISGAIAQLADEAVIEARAGAGAMWSDDTTIGDLLRRLVRLGETGTERLTLPSAVLPRAGAAGRLVDALTRRRLLLPETDGQFKLVHEAVFRHWPAAKKWLDGERRLLRAMRTVNNKEADWEAASRSETALLAMSSEYDLDIVAELLDQWFDVFSDPAIRVLDAKARDYALALLQARPMPLRVVEAASGKPCHVHIACSYGELELLQRYVLQAPECVHALRKNKRTPLFNLCFTGRMALIEVLLDGGARPDAPDEDQWQPIHAAATSGHVDVVDRLVRAGIAATTSGGYWQSTPLHLAANNGHVKLAEWLMARPECDPGAVGRNGWTPLHWAAQEGHHDMIERLFASGRAPLDARLVNDFTPLHLAASHGRHMAVRALIALGAAAESRAKNDWADDEERAKRPADKTWQQLEWTPLHLAVHAGHEAAAAELIVGGADPSALTDERQTALMMAVTAGHESLVRLLAKAPAVLELRDDKDRTAFHIALAKDLENIAVLLLDGGADVDARMPKDTVTPLLAAARDGSSARAQFLLRRGASTSATTRGGRAPLHVAAVLGRQPLVQLLIERGADLDLRDESGQNVLHLTAEAGHTELLRWLVQRPDVDASATDRDGSTALHLAARAGHLAAVAVLLRGPDQSAPRGVDARDMDGWTPLMLAAQSGRSPIVGALLEAGADVGRLAERPVMSALQAASEAGHAAVIALLLNAGASIDAATVDRLPALGLAVRNAQFDVAHLLLDRGAAIRGPAHEPGQLIGMIKAHQQQRGSLGLPISKACVSLVARLRTAVGAGGSSESIREPFDLEAPSRLRLAFLPFMRLPNSAELLWGPAGKPHLAGTAADVVRGLMHYPWAPMPEPAAATLCDQVSPVDGKWPARAGSTRLDQIALPWYDDKLLIRLTDDTWPRPKLAIYFICDAVDTPGDIFRLNGPSPPIHEMNARAPLKLTESNVLGYLKFFCFFVRGEEGPFHALETMDDPIIPHDAPGHALAVMRNLVRPATLDGRDEQGNYLCSAVVWYSNAIFIAAFSVQPGGMVEMLYDEPIAADLPLRIDAPLY